MLLVERTILAMHPRSTRIRLERPSITALPGRTAAQSAELCAGGRAATMKHARLSHSLPLHSTSSKRDLTARVCSYDTPMPTMDIQPTSSLLSSFLTPCFILTPPFQPSHPMSLVYPLRKPPYPYSCSNMPLTRYKSAMCLVA